MGRPWATMAHWRPWHEVTRRIDEHSVIGMSREATVNVRQKIYEIIQPDEGNSVVSRVFDVVITSLILASVVIVFAVTFNLPASVVDSLNVIEAGISIVFSIEYLLRIVTADLAYPGKGHLRSRIKYVFSPMAIIDLVAILPFWLPMFLPGAVLGLRAFRLVRLLRIFKLNRYFDAMKLIGNVIGSKKRELLGSMFFVFILMLVSSLLMYSAEHDAQPTVFRNAFSGLWWAVATLTTVGYGDICPITVLGRILGAVIALSGIAALAIPTGIITSGLTEHLSLGKISNEFEKQRKKDATHDMELTRQYNRDVEHDRILLEHEKLLREISEELSKLTGVREERQILNGDGPNAETSTG